MISVIFAGCLFGGTGCNVVITNRAAAVYHAPIYQARAAVNYNAHATYVAPAYTPSYQSPYYTTYASLAYTVEDPEKAALVRQNEILTRSVVKKLDQETERANRLEAALAQVQTSEGPADGSPVAQRAEAGGGGGGNPAFAVLQKHCLSCHGEGKSAASDFTLAPFPNLAQRLLIDRVVNAKKSMPPKSKPQLSPAELKAIERFAEVSEAELKRHGSTAAANDPPPQSQAAGTPSQK